MLIGDLILRMLADGSKLQGQVVDEAGKAGDAGGKTLGQKLGSALKTNGVKAFGTAAAGAFALATRGALELEDVQARFQAATGASADEASRAASVINKVAGENRLSLDEVADAAERVHNDLGLTGDAATAATAAFAKYARVTGQQAGPAVSAFDDILDAWGLSAEDATGVMDKLVVAHQQYGGSIADNQEALGKLAPQLQALGADLDDGISLLNLFAASGIDASKAQAALNTAVKNLKPGQTLDDLVREISSIPDPTKRAQRAIEVFGAKGGVALANALKPGITGLDDFGISAEEAAGATDKAADTIDSTFGNRIKKAISEARAAIRGFGKDLGPAVTGLASLASLAGSLGVDKVLGGAFRKAAGSAVVTRAIAFASGKAATLYLAGLIAGDKVTSALSSFWGKLPLGPVAAAGSKAGVAFSAAMTAAIVAVPVVVTYVMVQDNNAKSQQRADEISAAVRKVIAGGSIDGMQKALRDLQQAMKIEENQQTGLGGFFNRLFGASDERQQIAKDIAALQSAIDRATGQLPETVADNLASGKAQVTAGAETMVSGVPGAVLGAAAAARREAAKTPEQIAEGIRSKRSAVESAIDQLMNDLKNAMSPSAERARVVGYLTSEALAKGLKSKDPVVRNQAIATKRLLLERLREIQPASGTIGRTAGKVLAAALKSKDPDVRREARRLKNTINNQLKAAKGPAASAGTSAANAFISSVRRVINANGTITIKVRTSQDTIGGRAAGGPVYAGTPVWVGELGRELFVPSTDGYVVNHSESLAAVRSTGQAGGPGLGGDQHIHVPITVQGALPVRTIRDVSLEMQRAARLGAVPPRTLSPQYARGEATPA